MGHTYDVLVGKLFILDISVIWAISNILCIGIDFYAIF